MDTTEKKAMKETDPAHLSRLASVGQIAAGIVHEVRNPLTTVQGFLQMMEEDKESKYIHIAKTELDDALNTLNSLLQVAKPDMGDERKQSINLSVELENVLSLFPFQSSDVEVKRIFRDTNVLVYGKKTLLKKALFNLLKNAFEAIQGNGKITLHHQADAKYVYVAIQDTGIGIPEEKVSLLGTPFFSTKKVGTGMGLAQVYSVIHQHGGSIEVDSEENVGTTFTLIFPRDDVKKKQGVIHLDLEYNEGLGMKEFFMENREAFEERLLSEAVNAKDKIKEIDERGNINLLENAHKLVLYVVDEREHELIQFAKQEGEVWAKHSLALAFKLEWIQAIRRTLWDFMFNYDQMSEALNRKEEFYALEKRINKSVDQFLHHFFISYSKFKDKLIESQQKIVENLSVPIIPIKETIYILPIIGQVDHYRIIAIEDKVIPEVGNSHIETLIIDLSGVATMEPSVIQHLLKILEGLSLMGCKPVVTGLRPDIVKSIIHMNLSFEQKAEAKGTLQQALLDYI